jgi:cell shape-determining protein MreC
VETLLDKGLKIPAQCHETKEKGLIVRYNEELLAFKYLGTKPRIGEIVHTTHFQELYPENLKIGEVVRFEEDLALVKPCVDISRLNYVMILK